MSWTDADIASQDWTDDDVDDGGSSGNGQGKPSPVIPQQSLGRQLGLSARAAANVIASPVMLGGRLLNKTINAMGGNLNTDLQGTFDRGLNAIGLPEPQTGVEKFTQGMAQSAPAFALPASLPAQMAGNAAMSAIQAPQGEEGTQAAVGGGVGALGHGVARTLGGMVKPTAAAKELMDRGVALTPGQAAGAGSLANRAEQSLSSLPVASTAIRGAQRRGVEEANRAAAESVVGIVEQGKKLGLPPREAIAQTRDAIGKHYDSALEGLIAPTKNVQRGLEDSYSALVEGNPMMTDKGFSQLRRYVSSRFGTLTENGFDKLTGAQLKQIDSEIGQQISNLKTSTKPGDKNTAGAWMDLQQQLRDTMATFSTPEKSAALNQANAAYRQLLAMKKALLPGQEMITPRRLAATMERMGIKGTELNKVSEAMQKTLPNTVPDSGTAERLLTAGLPAMLMGGGAIGREMGFDNLGLGVMAAGALGTRGGARAMTGGLPGQKALSQAPIAAMINELRSRRAPPEGGTPDEQ